MEEVRLAIQLLLTATHNDAMNDGRSDAWRVAKEGAKAGLENLFSVLMGQLDSYKSSLDEIRTIVGDKKDQSTVEAVRTAVQEQPWREDEKDDPNYGRECLCGAAIRSGGRITHTCSYTDDAARDEEEKDVHTEHCCYRHGCKYGKDDCSVETGDKQQSHPCEQCCEEAADPVRSALQAFVDDFEGDHVWKGEIVDEPRWSPLTSLYKRAKKALEDS